MAKLVGLYRLRKFVQNLILTILEKEKLKQLFAHHHYVGGLCLFLPSEVSLSCKVIFQHYLMSCPLKTCSRLNSLLAWMPYAA